MKPTPNAMDDKGKVTDNPGILEHPYEDDEAPDDETGEDPDEEPGDGEIDDADNPITVGEPE